MNLIGLLPDRLMYMRIVLFQGKSRYNLLTFWTDELYKAFKKLDVDVLKVNLIDQGSYQADLAIALSKPADLFFSFNGIGGELEKDSFFTRLMTPFWQFYCDHPFHHVTRLNIQSPYLIPSFTGKEHIEAFNALYLNRLSLEIPHAGSSLGNIPSVHKKRSLPLVLFGSYTPPEEIEEKWKGYLPSHRQLLKDQVAKGMETNIFDPFKLLEDTYKENRIHLDSTHLLKLKLIYIELESYFRNYFRKKLLTHFEEIDLPIHLFGDGFEKLETSLHIKHKALPYDEMVATLSDCQIVLGTCPVFPKASHERPLTAMIQGAIAATEKNQFFDKAFTKGELLLYTWQNLKELGDSVKELLGNEKKRLEIAERGQKKTLSYYSFNQLAEAIVAKVPYLLNITRI